MVTFAKTKRHEADMIISRCSWHGDVQRPHCMRCPHCSEGAEVVVAAIESAANIADSLQNLHVSEYSEDLDNEAWLALNKSRAEDAPRPVFMSERDLARYQTFPKKEKRSTSWRDVDIAKDAPPEWRRTFEDLHEEFADVFDIADAALTKPVRGEPPIEFVFKQGHRPYAEREPNWKPRERQILTE